MTIAATLFLVLLSTPGDSPRTDEPVILDFTATWCGPCQQMRPTIEMMERKGYKFKPIDIDQQRAMASRYKVTGVPTFIIVDAKGRELARNSGAQPASELVALYAEGKAKLHRNIELASQRDEIPPEDTPAEKSAAVGSSENPKPWQTGVRLRFQYPQSLEYGSGTIIHSTEDETIILTCAHVFKDDTVRNQYPPSKFPHKIAVDLFDGQLHGMKPAMVHPIETVAGQAIDYDFASDVGLIRIRPGRKLPASPVVPTFWKPKEGMMMTTVGCSEGNNATAWTTYITKASLKGAVGSNRYEGIECQHAPKLGRSGGGLYTSDGYIAGVCDFAEPTRNHGLYASPNSIYQILDRNRLTFCYEPKARRDGDTMLADRGAAAPPRTKLRAQNGPTTRPVKQKLIPLPSPEVVGGQIPDDESAEVASTRDGNGWQSPRRANRIKNTLPNTFGDDLQPTDQEINPNVVADALPNYSEPESEPVRRQAREDGPRYGKWKPIKQ
jgi:thiol-disulfide isomerase/thioredoxin